MRRPRQSKIWETLRRNWRVRAADEPRQEAFGQLLVRELEQRRVLTVNLNGVMVPPAALAAMAEGAALSLEPGEGAQQPSTPEVAASAAPADPVPTTPDNESNSAPGGNDLAADVEATLSPEASSGGGAGTVSPLQDEGELSLTVASNQSSDEGALLTVVNIGQFSDSGAAGTYTYSINWGDGTAASTGAATIDVPGGDGVPTQGSFDGSHTYADNGLYTVTVTINKDDGSVASGSLGATINNVAPTLNVPVNQTTTEGSLLSISDIGKFSDPGFDNSLNLFGETSEEFTYAISWGDGPPLQAGAPTIDVPGSPGTPTQGSFDGSHTYADNGVYTVTVTISDDDGGTTSAQFQVTVNNVAPTLTVPGNQTTNEGLLLSITDIGKFTDPGFDNPLNVFGETTEEFTYAINWGDGTPLQAGAPTIDVPGSAGTPTQGSFDGSHTYADNGVYTVTVTISDDDGGTTNAQFQVTVNNVAPTLVVPPNQTTTEGATLSLTDIGVFTDPGFDNALNVFGETTEEFTYAINWGDGTPLQAGAPTIDVPGSPGTPTQGSFDGSHMYADNGVYTVTVSISDDDGGTTNAQFQVTVNNVAPTLAVPPNQTTNEGTLLSIADIGQFTDPGFDNPLNIGGETTEEFTYAINWGDGTPLQTGAPTIDVPGSPGTPTQGSFDGSHTYADNGVYTVTVTISDDDGGTTSAQFQVTVNNVAPTLTVPQNQTTTEGTLLSITNIGQFTDPGFDNPLNIGGETTEEFTYAVNWGDGTPLQTGAPTIDVPGAPGTPTQGSFDGSHTYADNGVYTVTVTISDDDGGTTSAQFQVTVSNVAPTLTVPPNQTVNEGSLLSITDIGKFSDPGFDNPLNLFGETTEEFTYAINWGDGTPLVAGAPTIDVPGSAGTPTQGSFDGSHTYADNGVYTVTVTISDDDGGTTSAQFQVTVNNVAPTLVVPPNQTTNEGSLLSITNIGQFTDPGFNNPLNVGGETSETFTFAINWGDGTPVNNGVPTIDVPGSIGIPTQGSFDGSHTYADNGVYTVTVTVSDDDGGVTSAQFQVTVNNVAPTLVVPPNQMTNEGSLLSITNIGQFTDPGFNNPLNVGGETSETFTYAINWGDGTAINNGVPTIDVPGSPGVPTQGSFDGSHTYADNGVYTVTVTISDDDGGVKSAQFQVTVNNVAPTVTPAANQTVNEGSLLSITNIGQFTDPGFNNPLNVGGETSETFTYAINWGDGTPVNNGVPTIDVPGSVGTPTQGSFDGSHTYADNGVYTVTVTVSDDDGGVTSAQFQVTVNNVAPTVTPAPNQTVNEGSLLSITNIGQFTDPGFNNPLNVGGETSETFTFAINWGDGTAINNGVPTIDVPGSIGTPTQGSFDGSHTYADNGVYTVTVTVSDDDGGVTSAQFQVTVNNVAPTVTPAPNQTVNEGSLLSITNIGQFTDPGFNNPLNVGGETSETFTFAINWGDGTAINNGIPTIDVPGSIGTPTQGSFDGSHTYADNGVYTVTVTVSDDDGGVTSAQFQVTVNNVAPTLAVPSDKTVGRNAPLTLTDIGVFNDPGFNNPLNIGGETAEEFTFAINWGDGTPLDAGPPTIDTAGSPGVLTAGSFNGQHVYTDGGIYTVTVTISDDDGGMATGQFLVYVGPTLTAAGAQVVNEGSLLTVNNIGQYIDPTPLNVRGDGSGANAPFAFTINWGDGRAIDTGAASVGPGGTPESLFAGSFNGSHTYADNGQYTLVLTITSPDGRVDTATIPVTVNNVAPSLGVVGNQNVGQTRVLPLNPIGQFSDPGFDNLLNVGGETRETFTFAINWGDGGNVDTGAATITAPGQVGVLTAGAFNGQHTYGVSGTYTVTVTVFDDDGGSATSQFQVTVASLIPQIFIAPGGGGREPIIRDAIVQQEVRPPLPAQMTRSEGVRFRAASVAGAEPRLVLRVVSTSGVEDRDNDEVLPNEVLDNLRKLFKRLPDGHYRIYQIQPDGIERLVVDVIVRQGQAIDVADEAQDAADAVAPQPAADGQQAPPEEPREQPGDGVPMENTAPPNVEGDSESVDKAALALGVGLLGLSAPARRAARIARGSQTEGNSRWNKVGRLLRSIR